MHSFKTNLKLIVLLFFVVSMVNVCSVYGQVNSVQYGKNRVQHKKLKWSSYQSKNFNCYYAQGGEALAIYAAQEAEKSLPSLTDFVETNLQRRANIIIYSSYEDLKQSNIGLDLDWRESGGLTKLINNKIVAFFDGNHDHLALQIKQGIARILTENLLYGTDIGEITANQALLDFPKWFLDGFVAYSAQNWSAALDDEFRNIVLNGKYKTVFHFAFDKPLMAGHAFWYYFAEKYGKKNVPYFLYLARIKKNLNSAAIAICNKKFNPLLREFMEEMEQKYYDDMKKRKNKPKGKLTLVEDVEENDYANYQINPNPKNNGYAVVEYKKGMYRVFINDNDYNETTLLKNGVRVYKGNKNPVYPVMTWDGKGTRLLVVYGDEGKIKMFVYDYLAGRKTNAQEIEGFDQIIDASYMLNPNTVIFSAVKNGQSDIFVYNINENKATQVTNDIYDDLNPTLVSFPNRTAIIYSSNRPAPNAPNADTVLPNDHRFNIFLVDVMNPNKNKQITQLTNLPQGNAYFPMQYNTNHFTFTADVNGIRNRYAGFFVTQREGIDSVVYIGDEFLQNPTHEEIATALKAEGKEKADSVSYYQVYKDSSYVFPITNYQSNILESRIAGNNGTVSEILQEGDYKYLYKLKVDERTLSRRNIILRPTLYQQQVNSETRLKDGLPRDYNKTKIIPSTSGGKDSLPKNNFQTTFSPDTDTLLTVANSALVATPTPSVRSTLKNYKYRYKFSTDNFVAGIANNILINKMQPYNYGAGPIMLNNGASLNFNFQATISDLFEDIKFIGGLRFGATLKDKDLFISFQNYKRRLDWGLTYYRSTFSNWVDNSGNSSMLYTNLYQGNLAYPFDETKSLRLNIAYRVDKTVTQTYDQTTLLSPNTYSKYLLTDIQYVYDNTLNPIRNIWKGIRWKVYGNVNVPLTDSAKMKPNFNFGFDGRYYVQIYRNFIWAVRAAADFSWGKQKIIYYLGGADGWVNPKFNNNNQPASDQTYAYQTTALNMRGYHQNLANGNNAFVINSEFRLPFYSTLFNRTTNSGFLRNLQLVQFIDLGTAWNGKYNGLSRPMSTYASPNSPLTVTTKAGGIGPFAGGYGFGARTLILNYFVKLDCAWQMQGIFKGKPILYFALGLDF